MPATTESSVSISVVGPDRSWRSYALVVGTRLLSGNVDNARRIRIHGLRAVALVPESNPQSEKAPLWVPSLVAGEESNPRPPGHKFETCSTPLSTSTVGGQSVLLFHRFPEVIVLDAAGFPDAFSCSFQQTLKPRRVRQHQSR